MEGYDFYILPRYFFLHTNIHCDAWPMTTREHNFALVALSGATGNLARNLLCKVLCSHIINLFFILESPYKTNTRDISNLKTVLENGPGVM